MKLANLTDEDLQKVSLLKNRKGCATSEALRAQQILRTRHITHGFYGGGSSGEAHYEGRARSTTGNAVAGDNLSHCTREYKSFEELNGCKIEEYGNGNS